MKKEEPISQEDVEENKRKVLKAALERAKKSKSAKPKEKILSRFKKYILDEDSEQE